MKCREIKELSKLVPKDDLESFYKNHNRSTCADHFNISECEFRRLIKYYNIVKSQEDILNTSKLTCAEKYGVEHHMKVKEIAVESASHKDYAKITEKSRQTCLEKYGVDSFSKTDEFKNSAKNIYKDDNKKEEANNKRKQTCLDKYGVEFSLQADEVQEKSKQTCLEKYNADVYMLSDDFKNKSEVTCLEKYGTTSFNKSNLFRDSLINTSLGRYDTEFPQQCDEVKEKIKNTNIEKYGGLSPMSSKEIRDKSKQTCLEKYGTESYSQTTEFKDKFIQTCNEHLGVDFPAQSREVQKKSALTRNRTSIADDSTLLDSSWECDVYNYFLRNDIGVERNIPIDFEFNGKNHTTFIDFKVDNYLIEVKAPHLLKGCFDYQGIPISKKLEIYRENHVIVITNYREIFGKPNSSESNGLKYENKCKNPLIGVDIDLFKSPEFPYAKDRPKCFYDVRVNNQLSSFEAFNDEKIRWKMIKNRIEYSGGFIDSKQILTALNVTRTCKQPSWFSKSFAKSIIEKYITSDTIVDSFAGWGARYDACKELNKNYIGIDLNPELVDWHKSLGRDINLGDANNFKYDGDCSVFICPPYQDVETYFESQDISTTQCQWLDIIMKNIPNAKEYVMVCKVVDSGWEKYIVDTKINKSHFGNNKEYILVIKNEKRRV